MPSNHVILRHPLFLLPSIFPSIRVFPIESILCFRWPMYWISASASVLPMNIQGWFPLGLIGLISLQSKGQSGVFSNITVQKHQFFSAQFSYSPTLTSVHDYWKNHRWTFVGKVTFLLFNMLSGFVIAFLPRSKCLLISWPQSPSAVIVEPKKVKSVIASTFSSSICHEVMGPDGMILVFECWVLSQLFHSLVSSSSIGSLVFFDFCFLP